MNPNHATKLVCERKETPCIVARARDAARFGAFVGWFVRALVACRRIRVYQRQYTTRDGELAFEACQRIAAHTGCMDRKVLVHRGLVPQAVLDREAPCTRTSTLSRSFARSFARKASAKFAS